MGVLEIVVIIAVIIAIVIIARIARPKRKETAGNETSSTDIVPRQAKEGAARNRSRKLGLAFVVAGAIFALAGISMFKWAVQGYVWAFVSMGIGFVILLLSRRR
jgi:hypothetical protein